MENINIVEFIEKNPINTLTITYNNKLLEKIKNNFTKDEQKLFITSFYCYLKYDKTKDFIINLDDIWEWLGFHQKVKAKMLLQKYFKENIDYKFLLCQTAQQNKKGSGGHNKETIFLKLHTL